MIIIDFNQVFISNLMMSLGNHTNTPIEENLLRHMVLNSLRSYMSKYNFDKSQEVIIACDDKNYWRKKAFAYYKGNRKAMRDASELDWHAIFDILHRVVEEIREVFPYKVIKVDGAEADDVIGTLCMHFGVDLGGTPILILSGDKDFAQLQKFGNVSQYDPVRKRKIQVRDPEKFLWEHIIQGDRGDGIPNVLSEDDCIVVDGKRQKKLTAKRREELVPDRIERLPDDIRRNIERNRMLIDLEAIPATVQRAVMEQYDQEPPDRSGLMAYFMKHRLKNLTSAIGDF